MSFIELIKYIILGAVQGFTEPIPISSSGHLAIFKRLINSDILNNLSLEIILNFGSLISIIIFFRKDIIELIKHFFLYIKTKNIKYYDNFKYCLLIIIGTIPAGIIGLLLNDLIGNISENIKVIGCSLLITSLFLYLIRNFKGKKEDSVISYKDAIIVGLFQCVALLPGISRSGATIVGAMLLRFKRETAFKFSFMLYIPISLATLVLGVKDIVEVGIDGSLILYYLIGMIVSGIVTYFSTKLFKNIMNHGKLIWFSIYCLIIGILVLIFL
ncbi:MAG: hypothetical protein NC181_02990 [Clostridium sp.]|nr:hypothetical protein [Clostridium sp.]MCM1444203.1 hypothetical protein [Candidatus Amulumruptor caecigallinarius]